MFRDRRDQDVGFVASQDFGRRDFAGGEIDTHFIERLLGTKRNSFMRLSSAPGCSELDATLLNNSPHNCAQEWPPPCPVAAISRQVCVARRFAEDCRELVSYAEALWSSLIGMIAGYRSVAAPVLHIGRRIRSGPKRERLFGEEM